MFNKTAIFYYVDLLLQHLISGTNIEAWYTLKGPCFDAGQFPVLSCYKLACTKPFPSEITIPNSYNPK
jgi:hypothetical protein